MKITLLIIVSLAFASTALGSGESISIGSYNLTEGSVVEVPVLISNAADVAGGKVTIVYNSSVIKIDGVLPGEFGNPQVNNFSRFVEISAASATAAGKQDAVLAVIKFRGVGIGTSELTIKRDYYVNDIKGNLYTPVKKNGLIIVNTEPSTASEKAPGFVGGMVILVLLTTTIIQRIRKSRTKIGIENI